MNSYLHFTFLIILMISPISIFGQDETPCYDAPNLDFSGTPIRFSYLLEDSLIGENCEGITYDKHRGNVWMKPLEYQNMYIVSLASASGTIIMGVDQNTHKKVWQQNYNHLTTDQQRAIGVSFFRKRGGDSLELFTYRSHFVFDGNLPQSARTGYPGRRIINYKTGELLSDYWVGDTLGIAGFDWSFFRYHVGLRVTNDYPEPVKNQDFYYTSGLFLAQTDTMSVQWAHRYVDTASLLQYFQYPPINDLEGLAAKDFYLNLTSSEGKHPDLFDRFGPYKLTDSTNLYFLRYLWGNEVRTTRLVLDDIGNLLDQKDITSVINESNEKLLWLVDIIRTPDNKFLFRGSTAENRDEFWEFGHAGYLKIDNLGNKIKERKQLVFDGLRPMLHNMCVIPQRNSLLHVFRPQENNDLYFYEEFEDGTYRRAGHLVNPNDAFYAFYPKNVWLMENGDVFVHLNGRLDSVWGESGINNFNLGGWHAMIRVDGQALGITTSTKDIGSNVEQSTIFPNPASTDIRIQTTRPVYPLTGEIINQLGQIVMTFDLQDDQQAIDVTALPSSMYFVRSYDPKTRLNVSIGKWMKE